MSKNLKVSSLDLNQMVRREFDEQNDAKRVTIVGGEKVDLIVDSDKIAQAVKESLSKITLMNNTKEIEKHVFIPQIEYKVIEVPVIIKEIEYKTIEKPIVVKEIIREKENDNSLFIKLGFIIQTVIIVGFCIFKLIKV